MKSKIIFIFFIVFSLLIFIKGYLFSVKYKSDEITKEYEVFIESLKSKSDKKVSYNVKLLNTQDKFILNIYDNSYDNVKTDLNIYSNYIYGDTIKIKGKIQIPKKLNNPGEFDYKLYLYSNNIHGLINSYDNPEQIEYNKKIIENIYSKIYMFKAHVQKIIMDSMSIDNAKLAMSMIFGDKTDLDEYIQEDFEAIGVSHLMSVSGTHIISFMLAINMLLGINRNYNKDKKKYIKNRKKQIYKVGLQILSICTYIIFTGFSVSVLRAGIMLIISIICDMLNKRKNKYFAMLIAFVLILIQTPFAIFNTGMLLSFLAALGIILFSRSFSNLFNKLINKTKNEKVSKIVKFLINNIVITVAVQLMIIPVQIQQFNKLPFPVIIPNLIIGIISTPIRVIGTFGMMLSFIPGLACKIFGVVEFFIIILVHIILAFKKVSFNISTVSMPVIFFVIYYIFVFCIFLYFKLKNISNVKEGKYNLKKLLKYLKKIQVVLAINIIVLVVWLNVYSVYFSKYVYFFNVEQGDMSYIKCENASVIVDIGSMKNGLAFNTISNFFKANNLNKVNYIIISHMHKDHINGLEQFLQKYKVGMVVYSKPKTEDEAYINFKKLLKKYKVNSKEVKQYDEFSVADIKIQVLLPGEEYINSKDEVNANSLVCKISLKDKQLLYMGDASKESEQKLIDKTTNLGKIYILKVGHHGSKTATSEEFVKAINPQKAVISAAKKYYGHPHEEIIQLLKDNNIYTYITEVYGAIKFNF